MEKVTNFWSVQFFLGIIVWNFAIVQHFQKTIKLPLIPSRDEGGNVELLSAGSYVCVEWTGGMNEHWQTKCLNFNSNVDAPFGFDSSLEIISLCERQAAERWERVVLIFNFYF